MAIQDNYEPLIFVEKRTISDGFGGFITEYVEGAEFMGAVVTTQTMERRIAEQQGVEALYSIYADKNVPIDFMDIIKRKADNIYFQVSSRPSDMTAPRNSTLNFFMVTAKEFTIPI